MKTDIKKKPKFIRDYRKKPKFIKKITKKKTTKFAGDYRKNPKLIGDHRKKIQSRQVIQLYHFGDDTFLVKSHNVIMIRKGKKFFVIFRTSNDRSLDNSKG